jgi:ABC-type transporter Mla MlaB component
MEFNFQRIGGADLATTTAENCNGLQRADTTGMNAKAHFVAQGT